MYNYNEHTTGYLLDYFYSKETYELITLDLSKQQALDADPKTMRHISFTLNLD